MAGEGQKQEEGHSPSVKPQHVSMAQLGQDRDLRAWHPDVTGGTVVPDIIGGTVGAFAMPVLPGTPGAGPVTVAFRLTSCSTRCFCERSTFLMA